MKRNWPWQSYHEILHLMRNSKVYHVHKIWSLPGGTWIQSTPTHVISLSSSFVLSTFVIVSIIHVLYHTNYHRCDVIWRASQVKTVVCNICRPNLNTKFIFRCIRQSQRCLQILFIKVLYLSRSVFSIYFKWLSVVISSLRKPVISSAVCLKAGPYLFPKRILHRVRWSASSFNFQNLLFYFRLPSSCLRLLPRLSVTSTGPSIFPSITCFRRQFLHEMWPIKLTCFLCIVCRAFLSPLPLCNPYSFLTRSVEMIFSVRLQHHISKLSRYFWSTFRSDQFQHHIRLCSKFSTLLVSSSILSPVCWWKKAFFLRIATFAMEILGFMLLFSSITYT